MNKKSIIIAVFAILFIAGGIFIINKNKSANNPAQVASGKINVDKIVLTKLNDSEKAFLESVKEKLRKNPEDIDALMSLARLQKYNGDAEDSLETLKLAEKIAPDNILVLNNELDMLFNLKKYDETEALALKIIEKNSQWINAYRTLQDVYRYHKTDIYQTDKFPDLVKKGMDADYGGVNKINFTALLAEYYKAVKNKKEALSWYEKYYALSPSQEIKDELKEIKAWN